MKDPVWQFHAHWNTSRLFERQEKAVINGVNVFRITRTRKNGEIPGKSKVVYAIGAERKEYSDYEELLKVIVS